MKSIFVGQKVTEETVKIEADVIVTATVLGFIGTRYHQNQPCGFDYEHPGPEDFRIWEVLDSFSDFEAKNNKEAKAKLMFRINKLWDEIRNTDSLFYEAHLKGKGTSSKVNPPKIPRSDHQTAQNEQYHNYLAKRLVLDLEKKYPKKQLLKSLEKAIDDYAKELKDYQDFLNTLEAMSIVLDQTDKKIGEHLDDSQSPTWKPGALITGLKGGAGVDFRDRHRQIRSEIAELWAKIISNNPVAFEFIYQGRGAYTGMVDNPKNSQDFLLRPTRRVIDTDSNRWHPGEGRNSNTWGLISPEGAEEVNLDPKRTKGMGPFPDGSTDLLNRGGIVGYIHGMSSAICKCIEEGPWCTPFEMAIGEQTTKMASCFACCTYMYAAGYPPSSMHLGRGESWVPPSLNTQKDGEETIDPKIKITNKAGDKKESNTGAKFSFQGLRQEFNEEVTSSVLTRWHREVYDYMTLGVHYLLNAMSIESQGKDEKKDFLKEAIDDNNRKNFSEIKFVKESHIESIHLLHNKLFKWSDKNESKINTIISERGGNLFLDALTVHQSDWKRIRDTLSPIFKTTETQGKEKLKKFGEKKSEQKSLSHSYGNSSRASTLPTMASTDEPVLLNGMKVIFDESASVYPVTLTQND